MWKRTKISQILLLKSTTFRLCQCSISCPFPVFFAGQKIFCITQMSIFFESSCSCSVVRLTAELIYLHHKMCKDHKYVFEFPLPVQDIYMWLMVHIFEKQDFSSLMDGSVCKCGWNSNTQKDWKMLTKNSSFYRQRRAFQKMCQAFLLDTLFFETLWLLIVKEKQRPPDLSIVATALAVF